MPSVTVFDSRIPVGGAEGSSHFSNGYNKFADGLTRVAMLVAVAIVGYKVVSSGVSLDLNKDGEVNTRDAVAFVDANHDGAVSVGEGLMAVVWAFLYYICATALWNLVRSFGPARSGSTTTAVPITQKPDKEGGDEEEEEEEKKKKTN